MPKFRDYFNQMFADNRELFLQFKLLNDDFGKDRKKYAQQFNQVGAQVVPIVREWEKRLCGHMEKGENATFSSKLADKFREEVKAYFPYIDFVGVIIRG